MWLPTLCNGGTPRLKCPVPPGRRWLTRTLYLLLALAGGYELWAIIDDPGDGNDLAVLFYGLPVSAIALGVCGMTKRPAAALGLAAGSLAASLVWWWLLILSVG